MLSFLRELAVVPLRLASFACGIVPVFDKVVLAKITWNITGNIEDACAYLTLHISTYSVQVSRELAQQLLQQSRDAKIAMIMSVAENQATEISQAKQWIVQAQEMGCVNQDFLLYPKVILSGLGTNYELADEIISNNSLPMNFSHLGYLLKCHQLIFEEQLEEANELAKKMLSIQCQYLALFIRWTYESRNSNASLAKQYLQRARKAAFSVGVSETEMLTVQGYVFLKNYNKACEHIRKTDIKFVEKIITQETLPQIMIEFFKSSEFQECHAQMRQQ